MRWITAAALSLLLFASGALAQGPDPIVYVRCPRTVTTLTATRDIVVGGVAQKITREFTGLDVMDVLPDVRNFFGGFAAGCDLMLRQPNGDEEPLFECSKDVTEANACSAMDPVVSFDGQTIAFFCFSRERRALRTRFVPGNVPSESGREAPSHRERDTTRLETQGDGSSALLGGCCEWRSN